MGRGKWEVEKMETYNMIDAIYRSTIQVRVVIILVLGTVKQPFITC